ncbi:MAG: TetR family transcriptional regulator [Actinocatenispora sp.]
MTARPRRAPQPEARLRDAERSRRLLLDAGLHEFADKGYAGARVQDIADRAGVNKQLINYYFGGKDGLYRELCRRWHEREAVIDDPEVPLAEVVVRYLRATLTPPFPARLTLWQALGGDAPAPVPDDDMTRMRHRQESGELPDDLEPEALLLAVMGMVLAPVAMPQVAARYLGAEPGTAEFEQRYGDQLRRMVRRLTAQPVAPADPPASSCDRAPDGTPLPAG